MKYKETIDFLYNNLPMYQRDGGKAFKPGLDNTLKLLELLGNPHQKFKTVHIAGTNGKGSVSHMLCAAFMASGHKTGLYTSPHLLDFRERVRVNGKMVKKDYVTWFVKKMMPLCEEIKPSFFEITVSLAFAYFAEKKVDYAVIETGLGGRLDSTNVILPLLSVITNIGKDHVRTLGDTLPLIAREKAGIIKKGVPVVIGESHPDTQPVFEEVALGMKAEISFADRHYDISNEKAGISHLTFDVTKEGKAVAKRICTDLNGSYQKRNLATFLMAVEKLRELGVPLKWKRTFKSLRKVKTMTGLMGRWDVVHEKPLVVLDTAHNADGFTALADQLKCVKHRKLFIIFGSVNDKDLDSIFHVLPLKAFYFFTKASMPRAMEINELFSKASFYSFKGITCANVQIAYKYAMTMAGKDDMVLITGSNFIIAEVLQTIDFKEKFR
jgi:dihydrofolate synthase / folylpolyglutamate synthase